MSLLRESGANPRVARLYAQLLYALRSSENASAAIQMATIEAGERIDYISQEKFGNCPRFVAGWTQDETFVLIDGSTTDAQVRAIHQGYNASITGPYEFPTNAVFQEGADRVCSMLRQHSPPPRRQVTIAGYSLGGAIACMCLAQRDANPWMSLTPQAITFGSPRVSNRNVCHDLARLGEVWRWFSWDDPIPYAPPHPDESLAFAIFAGRFNSTNYSRFGHPREGFEIRPSGAIVPTMLPTFDVELPIADMVAWYLGAQTIHRGSHSLTRFIDWIPVGASPRNHGGATLPNTPEVVTPPTERAHTQAARQVVNTIVTMQREQQEVPVRIPVSRVVTARKIGRVWGVYFGESLIVVRPSKRVARTIAKSLNLFLERLQNSAVVQPVALLQTMQSYLEAAADPVGGFTPVMNVRIPE